LACFGKLARTTSSGLQEISCDPSHNGNFAFDFAESKIRTLMPPEELPALLLAGAGGAGGISDYSVWVAQPRKRQKGKKFPFG